MKWFIARQTEDEATQHFHVNIEKFEYIRNENRKFCGVNVVVMVVRRVSQYSNPHIRCDVCVCKCIILSSMKFIEQ